MRKVAASAPGPKSKRSKVVKPSFWLEISCLGPATSIVKSILSFVGSGSMKKSIFRRSDFFCSIGSFWEAARYSKSCHDCGF